ncbi:7,8-didemethyl-8-hydroxy-5-deazariboflavin synthase CofG [Motiliproteus sp. MSK22-1]|uniref:7,8-didemethyl-8-hydroxy-5-deazariboflavin synthase CofG n=1 Tax=Motiliproteus sp. MSK22-1 TaxID=1897630 RepID=UPI0009756FAA|nr:7,8-didemethyl-8-hydroxy-5-deazariboflavin synthase CofG [Motiliproteus sp. MSK22-1]OMH39398.1 7,8-didemethyl-8-hydroxy-5-deazariboflavin synthase subunit CofG [Motiliproteus sp. MSK22-1]
MLSKAQALGLKGIEGKELEHLREQACALRDLHWGDRVTYSRKVFVPLTNMCRDTCTYCTFVKHPDSPDARIMTPEQVMAVVHEGQQMGCKEVLFSLGEKPEQRYQKARDGLAKLGHETMTDYLGAMCERVIDETDMLPHVNAGTLSEKEIAALKPVSASMGMMLETVSRRLLVKGQVHYACPDKVPTQRLRTLERAGRQDVPFTTGILIGIGETWEERIDSLIAINEIHQQYGHIQEVIVQNFCAKPGTGMADAPEPDLNDMLRTLAVARLILDPTISLQAPPNLQQRYSVYLNSGINDWGGISPLTIDHINPERAWPQIDALSAASRACGHRLHERLAVYPQYQNLPDRYFTPKIAERVGHIARADGLASMQCC